MNNLTGSFSSKTMRTTTRSRNQTKPNGDDCFTLFDVVPELILAGAFLKGFWEFDRAGAEVPEEDPEGVDVHRVVILSCGGETGGGEERVGASANDRCAALAITRRRSDRTSGRTGEQLRGHVDGGAHDTARHHGLWFTEAQVGDLRPVLLVQLGKELEQIERGFIRTARTQREGKRTAGPKPAVGLNKEARHEC